MSGDNVAAGPTRKFISQRLPDNFKFVFTQVSSESLLQLSGPITTQDELDAVTEALLVMREWLAASPPLSEEPPK